MFPLFLACMSLCTFGLVLFLTVCYRYHVMQDSCWDRNPDKRATFSQLKKTMDCLLATSHEQEIPFMDLDVIVQAQLQGKQHCRRSSL